MKKTGQLLKEARENKGISLQEVSIHLKISSRILRSLEEGDKDQLPAKTFLRGFVQSYAQFLKLDGAEVLELFQAEMGTTHPKMITKPSENGMDVQGDLVEKSNTIKTHTPSFTNNTSSGVIEPAPLQTPAPASSSIVTTEVKKENPYAAQAPMAPSLSMDQKTWSRSMKVGTLVIIIIIGGIIFGVVKTIEKYEREATIVKSESELEVLPRTEPDPLQLPLASENSNLFQEGVPVNPEAMVDGSSTPTPPISPLDATADKTSKSAVTPPTPTSEFKTEVKEGANPTTETMPVESVSRPQEVIIEALDKVTIEYSIDGKPKTSMVLTAEKVHTFKGDKKLSLSFSDGGSVNIIYNGKDKGVLGNLGKPLQLNFPE